MSQTEAEVADWVEEELQTLPPGGECKSLLMTPKTDESTNMDETRNMLS